MATLKEKYKNDVVPAMMAKFNYSSVMQVPRVEKVVVNIGVGEATQEPKSLDGAVADLTAITGQKPVITRAKKSIANFKVRAGMPIGCKVTLRNDRMYDFLTKLFNIVFPRIRDFNGISPSFFDGRGNYSLGLREQLIFPEIIYDKVDKVRGMQITICTSAETDEEARELLRLLGAPFKMEG